jgi:predicted DNA-binding transcriptional regulator AlpA
MTKMQFEIPDIHTLFGFYRLPVVLEKIPVSRSAWWKGIADGRYPAGVKIGPRTTAWKCSDIHDLCARLEKEGK